VMPKDLQFRADEILVKQSLMNLTRNSLDAIGSRGTIMLHAHQIVV